MKFGVCGGPEIAEIARQSVYDYFEWSVGGLLHPREDEAVFEQALAQARRVGLPLPAVNVFIPADLKITGPVVDRKALELFASTALRRAGTAGVEIIVFGSGGARMVPQGFDRQLAWNQLVEFCQMLGPIAQQYGVTVVVEPLNTAETNILNTVGESARLVRQVNHPNIRLLVDGYHWTKDGDSREAIIENADLIKHAHVATVDGRKPPSISNDCAAFFAVLREAGYDGRVSVEGNIADPAAELPEALDVMRTQAV